MICAIQDKASVLQKAKMLKGTNVLVSNIFMLDKYEILSSDHSIYISDFVLRKILSSDQ